MIAEPGNSAHRRWRETEAAVSSETAFLSAKPVRRPGSRLLPTRPLQLI